MRRADYLAAINVAYPDLRLERTRLVDTGQNNDVLIVNDELIFRFPRDDEGIERLEREIVLLDRIRPSVTLPVPGAAYRSFTPRAAGRVFAGYRMLPGEPLWHEAVETMADPATVRRLAVQLAVFLRALHAIPTDSVADVLAADEWREIWGALEGEIRMALFPHLPTAARQRIAAHFAAFLGNPANFAFAPSVIHGDFGTGNLLHDARTGEMTAVIDFGSAALGDPANDVAALLTYGEPFVRLGLPAYPAMEAMLPRARFYLGTFPLQEALYGITHDDPDAVERGLAPYLA